MMLLGDSNSGNGMELSGGQLARLLVLCDTSPEVKVVGVENTSLVLEQPGGRLQRLSYSGKILRASRWAKYELERRRGEYHTTSN